MTAGVEEQRVSRGQPGRCPSRDRHGVPRAGSAGSYAASSACPTCPLLQPDQADYRRQSRRASFFLVSGILYLNQFRAGPIDARVSEPDHPRARSSPRAIAALGDGRHRRRSPSNPEKLLDLQAGQKRLAARPVLRRASSSRSIPETVAPILRRLISPTRHARPHLRPRRLAARRFAPSLFARRRFCASTCRRPHATRRPSSTASGGACDCGCRAASCRYTGARRGQRQGLPRGQRFARRRCPTSIVRINDRGELIVSVAVPIQRVPRRARRARSSRPRAATSTLSSTPSAGDRARLPGRRRR